MAKKTKKKSATKAAPKTTKKKAKKKVGPKPVTTGKGATPAEIGADVVAMIRSQAGDPKIWEKWFNKKLTSIEGCGVSMAWEGIKQVKAKGEAWNNEHIVHNASVDGPFVGATGFALRFNVDVEVRATGERRQMNEVGVYTVKNGKVVQEEFMYGMG